MEQARGLTLCGGLSLLPVLKDGGDRAVGAGAEHERPGAGGVQPLGAVSLLQAEDADAGTESLLGMRPRAQNDLHQGGRVVADRGGLALDPLMRPVAVTPVRARHVLRNRARTMPA